MNVSCPGARLPTIALEPFKVAFTEPVQVLLIGAGTYIAIPKVTLSGPVWLVGRDIPQGKIGTIALHGTAPPKETAVNLSPGPTTAFIVKVAELHGIEAPATDTISMGPENLETKLAEPAIGWS